MPGIRELYHEKTPHECELPPTLSVAVRPENHRDQEIHCTTTNHTTAETPTVAADAPAPYHGETTERPTPVPSTRRITVAAVAATAPAIMAAHDTALLMESSVETSLRDLTRTSSRRAFSYVEAIFFLQREQDRGNIPRLARNAGSEGSFPKLRNCCSPFQEELSYRPVWRVLVRRAEA
jgi:hypothetical protein